MSNRTKASGAATKAPKRKRASPARKALTQQPAKTPPLAPRVVTRYAVPTQKLRSMTRLTALPRATPSKVQMKLRVSKSPIGNNMGPDIRITKTPLRMEGPAGTGLSACASSYAKVLANPFGHFDELPCVPCAPPTPTYRFRMLTRGQTTTSSTTGIGQVLISPMVPSNDVNTIFTSAAGSTATAFANAGVGIVVQGRNTMPFPAAAFTNGIEARLVGAGLRVRNITQALNVGGIVYALQTSVVGLTALSQAQVIADPTTIAVPQVLAPQSDWLYLNWHPSEMSELDWMGEVVPISALSTLGVLISAPAVSAPQLFEWEFMEFWEFQGESAGAYRMPEMVMTHADNVGLDRALAGAQSVPLTMDLADWSHQVASSIVDDIAHSDSAAKTVEDLLGIAGMAPNLVGGLIKGLTSFFMM